jgi:hypothetical protein
MIIYIVLLFYCLLIFYLIFIIKKEDFNNFKIKVSDIETKVEIINNNNFANYKEKLDNLYKKCVFSNGIYSDFNLNNSESLVFILKTDDTIIGSLLIDDFDKFNKKFYVNTIGAIEDKKGLYLTFLCGNDNYKGITKPLFDSVEEYAKNNNYKYILLEAKGHWRKKYYKKLGYKNITDDDNQSMIKLIN